MTFSLQTFFLWKFLRFCWKFFELFRKFYDSFLLFFFYFFLIFWVYLYLFIIIVQFFLSFFFLRFWVFEFLCDFKKNTFWIIFDFLSIFFPSIFFVWPQSSSSVFLYNSPRNIHLSFIYKFLNHVPLFCFKYWKM